MLTTAPGSVMRIENDRRSVWERLVRLLLGDDIFISYSRADGAGYAARLASELTRDGLSCRFDQWGSSPGATVPADLLRALGRSGLFVLVATERAGISPQVETEIRDFLNTRRAIVPIDVDGTIRSARWWPLIEGLAISSPEPLPELLDRIRHTLTFTRRNARLMRLAVAALVILAGLLVLSLFAGRSAVNALARAGESAQQAARESSRASEATAARVRAEADGAKAADDAARARGIAQEQERLAAQAVAERQLAQREAERQKGLTAEATANRRLAEQSRDAQQLAGRAQNAVDANLNPLMALAYGVAALGRAPTVEAGDTVARALSLSRTSVGAARLGSYVGRVGFTAKGRYLLVMSRTAAPAYRPVAVVLAADTMKEVLRVERDRIEASAVSADERYLAISDGRACVLVIDIETNQPVRCVPQVGVHDIKFGHDGRYVSLTSVKSGSGPARIESVRLWRTSDWSSGPHLTVQAMVLGVAFSRDHRHLAVAIGAGAQAICYWSFEVGGSCQPVSQPPDVTQGFPLEADFKDVAFTADGKVLRAGSVTGAVSVDLRSGTSTRFTSLGGPPVFDPSGSAFVARPSGGIATLWARGQVVGHLVHPGTVRDVRFSPDGQSIVTTCEDGLVRIWDAGLAPQQQNDFIGSNRLVGIVNHGSPANPSGPSLAEPIAAIDISPDGAFLATGSSDGWVRTWQLRGNPAVGLGRHGQWVSGVAPGPTPDTFLSSGDYYGRLWRLNPLREAGRLRRHENDAHGVFTSTDGRLIATTGEDSQVYLFDARTGRFLRAIKNDDSEGTIESALAGRATYLLTAGQGRVKQWDTESGALVAEMATSSYVSAMAMSPTESLAAISQQRRTLLVDTRNRLSLAGDLESAADVTTLTFDRTGDRLVIGLANGDVRLIDVARRREIRVLHHLDRVTAADFSPDNSVLATGSYDRTVRIWEPNRGVEIARLTRHYRVDTVAFIAGDTMIAAGGQNYVEVSPWRSSDLVDAACAQLRSLQGDSWQRLIGREITPSVCSKP
jgi:WD40 repeat protein